MGNKLSEEETQITRFGWRKGIPRVCIADSKQHIRKFLGEIIEERQARDPSTRIGFVCNRLLRPDHLFHLQLISVAI